MAFARATPAELRPRTSRGASFSMSAVALAGG
jgi:hypothetical protein